MPKEVKVLVPERVKKVIDEEDEKRRLEFEEWDKKQVNYTFLTVYIPFCFDERQISVTCIYNDISVELKYLHCEKFRVIIC